MKTCHPLTQHRGDARRSLCVLALALFLAGCSHESAAGPSQPATVEKPSPSSSPAEDESIWANAKRKEIGPNVFLEAAGDKRRALLTTTVCLREGYLEHFLSRTQAGKQHESILTAEFDARHLHLALELAGAKAGKPVQFFNEKGDEDFKPPAGDAVKVKVQYQDKGKTITLPAQRWVRSSKTKKELKHDWVFTGSKIFHDPDGKEPPYYGANDGRVICLANFTTALLDLPIKSIEGDPNEGLDYEANKEVIPPLETKVMVSLEPVRK